MVCTFCGLATSQPQASAVGDERVADLYRWTDAKFLLVWKDKFSIASRGGTRYTSWGVNPPSLSRQNWRRTSEAMETSQARDLGMKMGASPWLCNSELLVWTWGLDLLFLGVWVDCWVYQNSTGVVIKIYPTRDLSTRKVDREHTLKRARKVLQVIAEPEFKVNLYIIGSFEVWQLCWQDFCK
jgi:hypothetical protein